MKELNIKDLLHHGKYEAQINMERTAEIYHQEVHGDNELMEKTLKRKGTWWKNQYYQTALTSLDISFKTACDLKRQGLIKFTLKEAIEIALDIDRGQVFDSYYFEQFQKEVTWNFKLMHKIWAKRK